MKKYNSKKIMVFFASILVLATVFVTPIPKTEVNAAKDVIDGGGASNETDINSGRITCETLSEITEFVGDIYHVGVILLVVLLVILTMMDYTKAVTSGEQDLMKKANKHIVTRILIIAIFFFLPFLIELVIKLFLSKQLPDIDACLKF